MDEFDLSSAQDVGTTPPVADVGFDIGTATDVNAPAQTALHEESGKVVGIPAGMDGNETDYLAKTQVQGRQVGDFYGVIDGGQGFAQKVGQWAYQAVTAADWDLPEPSYTRGAAKGVSNFATTTIPQMVGSNMEEQGARGLQRQEEIASKVTGFVDALPVPQSVKDAFHEAYEGDVAKNIYAANSLAGKKIQESNQRWAETQGLTRPEGAEGVFYDVGSGFGSTATAVAMTMMTRSPTAAALFFGGIQKGQSYQEAVKAGADPETAGKVSSFNGVVNGALEALGNKIFFDVAHSATSPLRKIIGSMIEEGIQESTQQTADETIMTQFRDSDVKEKVGNILYATALGAAVGGPASGLVQVAQRLAQKEGLPVETVTQMATKLIERQAEIQAGVDQTLLGGVNGVAADPKAQAETAQVIKDFNAGKPIKIPRDQEIAYARTGRDEAMGKVSTEEVIQGLREEAAQKVDTTDEVARGRLKLLDSQVNALDAQIDQLSATMEEREALEKPNVANTNKLNRLLAQRDVWDEERANILTRSSVSAANELATDNTEVVDDIAEETAAGQDVTVKGRVLQKLGKMVTTERKRALEAGLREGRRLAKENVKSAQDHVVGVLEESGLEASDKAKFIRTVKNIQTAEQAEKSLPVIQARVGKLLEAQAQRNNKAKLIKVLNKTKVKKQSGKPVGKFTPDIQDALDDLRNLSKLSAGEAEVELEKRLAATEVDGQTVPPSAIEALQNRVLSVIADSGSVPSAESAELLDDLNLLVTEGKLGGIERLLARAERLGELRETARSVVGSGTSRHVMDRTAFNTRLAERIHETRGRALGYLDNWANTLDVIFGKDEAGKEIVERLGYEVSDKLQEAKGIARAEMDKLQAAGMKAYGFSKPKQFWEKMAEDSQVIDLGYFVDAAGQEVRLQMTKAEMRKRFMELQDPTLMNRITGEKGNAMTPEMIEAMTDVLTPEDADFAQAQLDLYRDFYQKVDEVYAPTYGVHLPRNSNYSPVSSEHAEEAKDSFFGGDLQHRRSAAPGGLKSRVANTNALKPQSDFIKFQKHVTEMAHFIAMSQKVQEINAVFNDPEVRKDIKAKYGQQVLGNIDGYIQDFARGRPQRLSDGAEIVSKLYTNFASSVLGAKLAMIPKQATSFLAYAENIPTKDFMAGVADFMAHPMKAAKVLNQSNLVKARGSDLERTIALADKSGQLGQSSKLQNLKHFLRMGEVLGDKLSLLTGGWAVYRYNKEVLGKSHEESLKAFDRATAQSQQSGDLDQQSRLQAAGGAGGRILTMFQSGQNQLFRREVKAIRDAYRGNITKTQAAKAVFLFHVVMPMFYQWVANAFSWDTEDEIRAGILGSFNGIFLLNDALDNGLRAIMGDKVFDTGTKSPFGFVGDVLHGIKKLNEEDADLGDMIDGWRALLAAAGVLTGYPLSRLADVAEGAKDISEDNVRSGISRISGFPNAVGDKLKEEEDGGY